MKHTLRILIVVAAALVAWSAPVPARELPCSVCAGVRMPPQFEAHRLLSDRTTPVDEHTIFAALDVELDGTTDPSIFEAVTRTGASLWIRAIFRTPQPIADNLGRLEGELEELARLVRRSNSEVWVEAVWLPGAGRPDPVDLAFLIKRAAVAVTGAAADAVFTAGPLEADPEFLRELYEAEVAAYLDLVTLAPGADLGSAVAALRELDPGKPLVLDALPWPANAAETVARVAEASSAGIAVTFFDLPQAGDVDFAPLQVLVHEFDGSLVFDPYATSESVGQAWSFVREDLDLRVVAVPPGPGGVFELNFSDSQLRSATLVDLGGGGDRPLYDTERSAQGLTVRMHDPGDVVLLRLTRPSAEELAAFDDTFDVSGDRQIPVEEILRRLQAFEDDQARRIDHYQARRTLHLRFQSLEGSFEATYSGEFFNRLEGGFDWVWEDFSVGGVRWRSKKLPKVPLIQPEKVASLPAEIRLLKDYDYRLRGEASIDGRDCWVIDFKPVAPASGRSLYRGTVWVDREVFARVRTRATQIGLEGSVLSNEETWIFRPVDAAGQPAPWSRESFVLPLKTSGQQTLSLLSSTLPVEVETVLEDVVINGADFESNRNAALSSEATMLRDTNEGLRYLRKNKNGERFVETELDSDRLFLVGGVLWDESLDYPLPLAGINYLNLDLKDTGAQVDVFFAGAFLAGGIADPQLFGSRFNGGINVNGLFVKGTDELYRQGEVVPEEAVRRRAASVGLFVGRALAKFLSFELTYRLRSEDYSRADDTAAGFVLPQDTLTHSLRANVLYNRSGYRLGLYADTNSRADWAFWGLPGNDEFHPDQKDYLRWRANFAKTWWLPKFRKITLTLEHLDGEDLDRFSGYDFGLLGDATIAGYPSGLVRAESADGLHLTAGVNYLDLIRFEFKADAVWASNRMTGLDNELLSGIGAGGTITLPWQLIMNFEAGYALTGPGKGDVAIRVFFLRLFPGS